MRPSPVLATALAAALVTMFALVALAPGVVGHGAPNPLEIETYVLLDEAEDAFLFVPGYDLFDLYAREAHWGGHELDGDFTDGLIFRFTLYGGFSHVDTADTQTIELGFTGPAGPASFTLTTTDDETWEGTMEIVEIESEYDTRYDWFHKIQAIVPYSAFNATVGDNITDIWMKSYVDDELVDVAPGPYYVPGSGGMGEVSHAKSERFVDELPLTGPLGYTNTTVSGENGTAVFTIQNPMQGQGQHLHLEIPPGQGWDIGEPLMENPNLPAGNNTTIRLPAAPQPGIGTPLLVYIATDVGGREPVYLGITEDGTFNGAADPDTVTMSIIPDEIEESPAPALLAVALAGLVGLAGLRRGRD